MVECFLNIDYLPLAMVYILILFLGRHIKSSRPLTDIVFAILGPNIDLRFKNTCCIHTELIETYDYYQKHYVTFFLWPASPPRNV